VSIRLLHILLKIWFIYLIAFLALSIPIYILIYSIILGSRTLHESMLMALTFSLVGATVFTAVFKVIKENRKSMP